MPRSNVKVVLRTRPCSQQQSHLQLDTAAKTVTLVTNSRGSLGGLPGSGDKAGPPQRYQFKFDGFLHEASQEEVFELCAADMVRQALDGYNGCIMCYGQTGAGKTHTMSGNTTCYEQRGLIPRVLAALLSALRSSPGLTSWGLALSYLEVYNDVLYDLLDINTSPSELTLYEDAAGQLQVAGARKVSVSSEAEALALFFEGETNRVIGQHQLNRESSRSHSVFIAHTTCVHEGGGDGSATASKLCLVDLAGSERVAKTRSEGLLLREAGAINKSLALLEQVVLAAAAVGRGAWQHVPYRTCKLTHVLKDCLGGNCATLLVANVWGEAAQLEETLSTCRFASRMAALEVDISRNVQGGAGGRGSSARVKALEREVQELREELAMMELMHSLAASQQQQQVQQQGQAHRSSASPEDPTGTNGSSSSSGGSSDAYAPYSLSQRQQLKQVAVKWLQQQQQQEQQPTQVDNAGCLWSQQQQLQQHDWCGDIAPLPLHHVRHLRELLYAYKAVMRDVLAGRLLAGSGSSITAAQAAAAAGDSGWDTVGGSGQDPGRSFTPQQQQRQRQQQSDVVGVGDDDGSFAELQHHAACAAPDDARPSSYGDLSTSSADRDTSATPYYAQAAAAGAAAAGVGPGSAATAAAAAAGGMLDRETALLLYREGPGATRASVLNDNHSRLKAAKRRRQLLAEQLNGLKAQLDDLLQQHEAFKQQRLHAAAAAMASGNLQQQQQQVLGPEELQLVNVIRDVKASYREAHAELALVRDEVSYTAGLLETCKAELAAGFEAWYSTTYGGATQQQQQQAGTSSWFLPASRQDSHASTGTAAAGGSWSPAASPTAPSSAGGLPAAAAGTTAAAAASGGGGGSSRAGHGSPMLQRVHSMPGISPVGHILQQQQQWRRHTSGTPPLATLVDGLSSASSSGCGGGVLLHGAHSGSSSGRLSSAGGALGSGSSSSGGMGGVGGQQGGNADAAAAAAAFFEAQQSALGRTHKGGGGGGSSVRRQRAERGTFSLASRGNAAEVHHVVPQF